MFSILISTYNYDCHQLVFDLRRQCESLGVDYEIIVGDDCSTDAKSMEECRVINSWDNCSYVVNQHNVGLAANRNLLAGLAKYEWLIFLDSDAAVRDDGFMRRYYDSRKMGDVIVGGLLHPDVCPNPHATLRYKYERKADKTRGASFRMKNPYLKFSAFNIMVNRKVFDKVRFDERCRHYGYEDVLFGSELKKLGIGIVHIDNPMTHMGLDSNDVFLKKSETALHTLLSLEGGARGLSSVENLADKLDSFGLSVFVRLFFKLFRNGMRKNLLSNNPSLFIFSVYKLGYFVSIKKGF